MNPKLSFIADELKKLNSQLGWSKMKLDMPHLETKLDQIVALQKWETQRFRRLLKSGQLINAVG